jgi:hypothetical protein
MPQVKVTHDSLSSDNAREAPRREPIPPGDYVATIAAAPLGITKGSPPLQKISVEFHILYACTEPKDTTHEGRHLYQDYILEKDPRTPDLSQQRRRELRMMLDATGVSFTDEGFNTDHLVMKVVKISVKHRKGKQPDENGNLPTFTNVVKVDTAETVDTSDFA